MTQLLFVSLSIILINLHLFLAFFFFQKNKEGEPHTKKHGFQGLFLNRRCH